MCLRCLFSATAHRDSCLSGDSVDFHHLHFNSDLACIVMQNGCLAWDFCYLALQPGNTVLVPVINDALTGKLE